MIALTVLCCVLVAVIHRFLQYRRAVAAIQDLPGYRILLWQGGALANFLLPPVSGISPGVNHIFRNKYKMYEDWGRDVFSSVCVWPQVQIGLTLANAAAVKEVTSSRARFPKPTHDYRVLSFFGRNIVGSEGEEWKRYRKIAAPAFSERNNRMVWETSVKVVEDMFNLVWRDQDTISVDHCVDVTLPIALFIIGVAGFGRKVSWEDDEAIPSGHLLTFKNALHVVTTQVVLKLIVPDRLFGMTEHLRNVRLAFDELRQYMKEMIDERQNSDKGLKHDLFNSLLDANDVDDLSQRLTDDELLGNIFIFLVAGHETTSHTLCFAFALLALYPEEQDKLHHHIMGVLSDKTVPTYDQMPQLTHSMAVFNETLRMFPPVPTIPKISAEDTTLVTENSNGERQTIPVPKGTKIIINTVGLHYNQKYWHDPSTFKPSRFLGDWPRDAFQPYSSGARACLGRRFFETEGIAILTMLVARYKIEVKEEPQFVGETFEERKARILTTRPGLTLTPVRVPLVFKRRV
ncbi:cytochrome P450 [Pluteus cervinus]|uniref:Cytochrome P450 n=1 Tax=Pluteus cervinus TaxID=181527 RepID=A0ACD3B6N4_9AGAR|nr:cytochrome P450 [Pluteus cervinus]